MKNILSKGQLSLLIVLGILILDQVIKIEVKTNMFYNESIHITDWFYLRFIENLGGCTFTENNAIEYAVDNIPNNY